MNQVAIIGGCAVLAAVWSAALTTWMFWLKQKRIKLVIDRNSAPVRTIPLSESMQWARAHPKGTLGAKMSRGVDHPRPTLPLSRLAAHADLAAERFPREPSYSSTWPDELKTNPNELSIWSSRAESIALALKRESVVGLQEP